MGQGPEILLFGPWQYFCAGMIIVRLVEGMACVGSVSELQVIRGSELGLSILQHFAGIEVTLLRKAEGAGM
jgi:hypothetical protein